MNDIVTRLRTVAERFRYNTPDALANHIAVAADEIERLRNNLDAITNLYNEMCDQSDRYALAANQAESEIERLRDQCAFAHAILSSEPMLWLTGGTSNHTASWWAQITPAIHDYWEKYGSFARPTITNGEEARRA